ncbi:mitochondrial carrier domain-containing protein [Circinella umbellata]|nr:mitochondrial carrier domain-containing protein [Circinella umbellata]
MVGKFVEYPFDTIKVRLQTQPLDRPYFNGPWHCFKCTIKQEGLRGLFTGMASPMVGSMVENAALFVGYRQVQRLIREYSATAEERVAMSQMAEADLPQLSLPQLVLAGTASGAMASFVLTPVELVKCKLQVQLAESTGAAIAGNQNITTRSIRYRGPMHVISYTLKNQGLSGFYRGYLATLIREAGGGAFWFGVYEYACAVMMRRRNTTNKKDLSAAELMLAGGLGGAGYNLSFYPVDVIKSHMQTDQELLGSARPRSFIQTTREVYAGAGIKGFYRGCGITVARSLPTSAIIFLTYETLSDYFG